MSLVTKRALEASLKNLLLKKPLDKITINDIADDCGINRMTFYYHFRDIYDFVEWSCAEDAKKALDGKKTYQTWQQGLLQIFEAVYNTIVDRKKNPKEGSYTNYLFDKGLDKILKKVGEEATEIVIAAKNPNQEEVKYEISDFLYHMMVLMVERGITWEDITKELSER